MRWISATWRRNGNMMFTSRLSASPQNEALNGIFSKGVWYRSCGCWPHLCNLSWISDGGADWLPCANPFSSSVAAHADVIFSEHQSDQMLHVLRLIQQISQHAQSYLNDAHILDFEIFLVLIVYRDRVFLQFLHVLSSNAQVTNNSNTQTCQCRPNCQETKKLLVFLKKW